MNEQTKNSNKSKWVITILIFTGILSAYVAHMHPSAVLTIIMEDLNINLAQAGLGLSIIFPVTIIVSLIGGQLEQKLGVRKLYIWSMVLVGIGLLIYFMATTFAIFLIGRIILGIGFGLSVPFIGSAIMKWYNPKEREMMNTLMALFPYFGTFIDYSLTIPMYTAMGHSWRAALGVWGFVAIVTGAFWILLVKDKTPVENYESCDNQKNQDEKHLYHNLWKRHEIKILCLALMCDFASFSFIAGILPTFYEVEAGMTLDVANNLSTLFPIGGVVGALVAGVVLNRTGKRKPLLWLGQAFKFIGIFMMVLGLNNAIGIIGLVFLGLGNALWMPSLYTIPMDLENMNPTRVGGAFALITSCGFSAGFISPIIGGWLSDIFTIKYAILMYSIPNLIAFIACLTIKETGSNVKVDNISAQVAS